MKKIIVFIIFLFLTNSMFGQLVFRPKGILINGDLGAGSVDFNLKSDPKPSNFSFGTQYSFIIYSNKLFYSPGIELSYLVTGGNPQKAYEIFLTSFLPISLEYNITSRFSVFSNYGITLFGKHISGLSNKGSVLDGQSIKPQQFTFGIRAKLIEDFSVYTSLKYYSGDSYIVSESAKKDMKLVNMGVGISYQFGNNAGTRDPLEVLVNRLVIEKNKILQEKNELEKKLKDRESELLSFKNNPPIDNVQKDKIVHPKIDTIQIDIKKINEDYDAKFYKEISIMDFITQNKKNLSDNGEFIIEAYHDLTGPLLAEKLNYIKFIVPERYFSIFQNHIQEKKWNDNILIEKSNSDYVKIEFNTSQIYEVNKVKILINY